VRVLRLPVVSELRHGSLFAVGDEDRVETEAFRAAWLVADAAFQDSRAAQFLTRRRERDELAHIASAASVPLDAGELGQEPVDVQAAGEAGRLDARRAAEALDLEPRVLAQDPGAGSIIGPAVFRFRPGVVVVRLARLRRVVVGLERLELPARKGAAQLP
jgi:hypothetical protein